MSNDAEDFDVTQAAGDDWGIGTKHRSMSISRCANGYTVDYQIVRTGEKKHEYESSTKKERRVFITNADLFEFVQAYYADEPKPEPRRMT